MNPYPSTQLVSSRNFTANLYISPLSHKWRLGVTKSMGGSGSSFAYYDVGVPDCPEPHVLECLHLFDTGCGEVNADGLQ